jgi:tetratricopeptide (TPR) repeat protein
VAEDPTTEVLTVLVKLYEEQGNWQGAIRTLDRLENLEGKSANYSIEKFKIYIEQNDTEKAYAAIEELCAEYPADLRYRVLLGDLYHQNGYPELALATYNDVLAVEPENSFAQVSLLAYYKNAGQDSLYLSLIDEVVLNPNTLSETRSEIMYNFVRDTFRSHGDTAHVDHLFQKALALPQTDASLPKLYLDFLTTIKAPEETTYAALKQILEIEPDNSRARGRLLEISLRQNNYAEAIRLCREGQLYDPNLLLFYYYEGLCLFSNEEKKQAIDALQRGATHIDENTDPQIASDLYATLGDIYFDMKEKDAAFAAYDSALVYKSDNFLCMNNYAYYLSLEEVELDKAEAMSRKTVEAFPEEPTYLDTYAWVLFQKQQYTQARLYIDETLKYAQEIAEDAGLFEHAGDIYYKCGDKESAVNFWKKALSLSADEEQCAKLQKKIKLKRWVP